MPKDVAIQTHRKVKSNDGAGIEAGRRSFAGRGAVGTEEPGGLRGEEAVCGVVVAGGSQTASSDSGPNTPRDARGGALETITAGRLMDRTNAAIQQPRRGSDACAMVYSTAIPAKLMNADVASAYNISSEVMIDPSAFFDRVVPGYDPLLPP
jgi:hypothetical protein